MAQWWSARLEIVFTGLSLVGDTLLSPGARHYALLVTGSIQETSCYD